MTDFNYIKNAIQRERTILFIGPKVTFDWGGNVSREATFLQSIMDEHPDQILSFHKQDGFLIYRDDKAKKQIRYKINDFYKADYRNDTLRKIADIPFHIIVTVSPDMTMNTIFENKKYNRQPNYYEAKKAKKLETPTAKRPLIYNLLGCVEEEETLILSHFDLYESLKSIHKDETLPKILEDAFSGQNIENIIFLGFDFDKWYFQLVLHLLKLDENGCVHHAILNEPPTAQNQKTANQTLFKSHFKINFVEETTTQFVNKLYERFEASELRQPTLDAPSDKKYIDKNVFKLLGSAFSASDLDVFCMINYETVQEEFTAGMTKSSQIKLLVDYVKRHNDYENLLTLVKEENPIQHEKNQSYF